MICVCKLDIFVYIIQGRLSGPGVSIGLYANVRKVIPGPGVVVPKQISSISSFSYFSASPKNVSYWVSRSYLTGVVAAHLRWHMWNMNVMLRPNRYFGGIENVAYGGINEWSFSNPLPLLTK